MPAKLQTICYIHDCNEKNTAEFIIKEVTAISRLNEAEPTEIIYLRTRIMPAKLQTICYIHDCNEKNTAEFIIKEVTAISRLNEAEPTEIIYLRTRMFIPLDQEVETHI
ncbi:hypothetical protein Glove_54g123 [Diversispora epigaea]|uniref:Uncharacterized protein n=1 Tax=Diversispora epigaea TaxID=1348612 RepID=A0A397JDQ9_9GLOM|nr:hypothetical protein Glove_54g123 [Diversispora epigaea]